MTSDKTNPEEKTPESTEEVPSAEIPDTDSVNTEESTPLPDGEGASTPEEPSGEEADVETPDTNDLDSATDASGETDQPAPEGEADANEDSEAEELVVTEPVGTDLIKSDNDDEDEDKEEEAEEKNMGILDHLEELRSRLIYSALSLFLGFLVALFISQPVVDILFRPFEKIEIKRDEENLAFRISEDGTMKIINDLAPETFQELSSYRWHLYLPETEYNVENPDETPPDMEFGQNMKKPIYLSPLDPLMIWFKATLILGIIISLPLILWQVWLFVAPGLKEREKKTIIPIIFLGCILFPIGASFAYFAFSIILDFLCNFQGGSMEAMLNASDFLHFEMRLMVGFGLAFELPIVVMFLTMLGLLTPKRMREWRPYAIVAIAVTAMFCTPPDPFSMMMLMVPLYVLYEFSIIVSIPIARKKQEEEDKLNKEFEESEAERAAEAAEASSDDDSDSDTDDSTDDNDNSDDEYNYEDEYNSDYDDDTYSNSYYSEEYERTKMNRKRWKRKQLTRRRRATTTKVASARKAKKR